MVLAHVTASPQVYGAVSERRRVVIRSLLHLSHAAHGTCVCVYTYKDTYKDGEKACSNALLATFVTRRPRDLRGTHMSHHHTHMSHHHTHMSDFLTRAQQ